MTRSNVIIINDYQYAIIEVGFHCNIHYLDDNSSYSLSVILYDSAEADYIYSTLKYSDKEVTIYFNNETYVFHYNEIYQDNLTLIFEIDMDRKEITV